MNTCLVKCKRQPQRGNFSVENCHQSRIFPCGRTGQFALRLYCIQRQRTQLFGFILMTERRLNEHNRLLLAAALLREQNRQRRRPRPAPRVNGSWLEIDYNVRAMPETFFLQQFRMNRATCDTVLNTLGPRIARENSLFRACLYPAKILTIGLYCLVHGNSFLTIVPAFNVKKSTVIET